MQRESWHIEMLGGLRACQEGQPPIELPRQQTGALLAYLALRLNRSHTREELMALVWPEDTLEEARHKLRQSLYTLRRQMERSSLEADAVLLTTRAAVQLNPGLVTTDVARFEQALQDALRTTNIPQRIDLLTEALRLYRGDLLPGFYQEEFLHERSRLADLHRSAVQRLTRAYESAGDLNHAIETGLRAIALDPLMEEAHCDLMRLYAAAGQPSAVLRQYQELADIFKEEMGEEPPQATRLMMESLRQTAQANATTHGNGAPSAAPVASKKDSPPVVSGVVPPVPTASAFIHTSPARRTRIQPLLAVGGAMLCMLLTWQALGRHAAVSTAPVHAIKLASRTRVDPVPVTASRSAGTTAPSPVTPQPKIPPKSAARADRTSKPLPLAVATVRGAVPPPVARKQPAPPTASQLDPPTGVQPSPILWKARYEAQEGDKTSEATAVTADPEGNIYVTGFVDTVAHDADFLTLKYDLNGTLLWEARYNGPGNDVDRARAIAVDGQGNVYVTGESDNGKGNNTTRLAGTDFATIKYGPDGEPSPTWPDVGFGVGVRRYNGPDDGEDRPVRLLVDESGVYVLGRSWGRGRTGKSGFNYALVKYDGNGDVAWTFRYDGGHGDDEPADMARDRDGNIYVTGQSRAEPASGPEFDMLTVKVSNEGEKVWEVRQGAHNLADDHACAIEVVGYDILVVGEGRGAPGTPDAARIGCITVKYDSKGHLLWARGTVEERDRIETLITAKIAYSGEVIATGLAHVPGAIVCRAVLRDSNGLPRWAADFGQVAGDDGPSAAAFDPKGVLLCGGFRQPHGDIGFVTLRYSSNGKPVWRSYLEGTQGQSRAYALTSYQCSPVVVGQTSDGKSAHLTVIKYRP